MRSMAQRDRRNNVLTERLRQALVAGARDRVRRLRRRADPRVDPPAREGARQGAGLAVGAFGIALLWAGGVEFPVAIPPGIVILAVGAALATVRKRWTAWVGCGLSLFVLGGFLLSGKGFHIIGGSEGGVAAVGQTIAYSTRSPRSRSAPSHRRPGCPALRRSRRPRTRATRSP